MSVEIDSSHDDENLTSYEGSKDSAWLKEILSQPQGVFEGMLSTSHVLSMSIGTGSDIISKTDDFIWKHLKYDLILVTCFWAKSESLRRISDLLLRLSEQGINRKMNYRIRICISSLSLKQKLNHTKSPQGKIYWDTSEWESELGLPAAEKLRGLWLQIKSVFIRPFSVMHSKFIILDKKTCLLPSCNVSWENWFEGCLDLRGPIVHKFIKYWEEVWGLKDYDFSVSFVGTRYMGPREKESSIDWNIEPFNIGSKPPTSSTDGALPISFALPSSAGIRTLLLPSEYHQNPNFRPFPWQKAPDPPNTPLNNFTLRALDGATISIYLQSPNVTAPPVLSALRRALTRGVNVRIVTNKRLMLLEQLLTAGTTTGRCMKKLMKSCKKLQARHESPMRIESAAEPQRLGKLRIEYYEPGKASSTTNISSWPVSSHLKLTIVDGEVTILGSGNMDRASWYTSQELGVALLSWQASEEISEYVLRR